MSKGNEIKYNKTQVFAVDVVPNKLLNKCRAGGRD